MKETHFERYSAAYMFGTIAFLLVLGFILAYKQQEREEAIIQTDYQIFVENNGTVVYDGDKFVGFLPYTGKSSLDSLIDIDNK